ncbi:zinc uptake transporter [Bacillus manliponensis]|uniref:Zinc uptake transporter n=1 Tax=Bacillus manliponensis TaxID=574376 RepID=A0A073JV51_9BACI|nr:ZIP family metal transporter [Bacillus manliponensis]KEK18190.1 zinc uptake transporter [Bacillus manliponensis]
MQHISTSLVVTILSFGGLLVGGSAGFVAKQFILNKMNRLYALCGGLLLALLILEIIPETFSTFHLIGPLLGIILGVLFMIIIHSFSHSSHSTKQQPLQTFLFLSLAIFIHNIPNGIALGAAFASDSTISNSLLLAIIFHHIPEGLALIIPFFFTHYRYPFFLLIIFLLSATLGFSTIVGNTLGDATTHLQGIIMGSAIGSLSYVTLQEMLKKAYNSMTISSFFIWVLIGFFIVNMYIRFLVHH